MKNRRSTFRFPRGSKSVAALGVAAAFAVALPLTGFTQEADPQSAPSVPSPILTVDQEALFTGSDLGQRIISELERDRTALAAENRRIEAELSAEEQELTQIRSTLMPHEFSQRAEAFDAKVQAIRAAQDGKARALQQRFELERQEFVQRAAPILASLAQARGAVMVLDSTLVLMAFDAIDVTDDVILELNAAIGNGITDLAAPQVPGLDALGDTSPVPLARPNLGAAPVMPQAVQPSVSSQSQ